MGDPIRSYDQLQLAEHRAGIHDADDFLRTDCVASVASYEDYLMANNIWQRPTPVEDDEPLRVGYSCGALVAIFVVIFTIAYFGGHVLWAILKGWIR